MPFSGATSAGTEFAEVSEYPAVLPAAIVPEESGVPALPEETAVLPVGTEELPAAAGELPAGVWVLPGMVVPAPVVDGPGFAVRGGLSGFADTFVERLHKILFSFHGDGLRLFIALKRIAGTDNHTFIADEPHGTIGELTEDIV